MKVLLGVTGCIAAYKSCEILRGFQKHGIDVEVVMTEHALEFIGAQTFSALSGKPAKVSNFKDYDDPIAHIRLAEECDLFLIAPCTANVLSKIANGIADDLLTTCALAAHDKLAIAPAMNVHMYEAPTTQENLKHLKSFGVEIIEPGSGYLACGDIGPGRLAEPDDIVSASLSILQNQQTETKRDLVGKKVVITAGPTRERIDPVRFITNDSSGKMGIALANAASERGADVSLVLGHVSIEPHSGIRVIDVETSDEMFQAVEKLFDECDIAIFSAAVCDIKPINATDHKLKKGIDDSLLQNIETQDTIDILKYFASNSDKTYVVGFAAETDNVLENGKAKLVSKDADMIVANEVGFGKTFGKDESKAWIIEPDDVIDLETMSKSKLANVILDNVCANMS